MGSESSVHLFGIRHHGPGSARSVAAALAALKPDCLLVEGPPDAAESLPLLLHREMEPPVALLGYRPESPRHAAYYPFAIFSPEWQALKYGLKNKINVAFLDLPLAHQFALEAEEKDASPRQSADRAEKEDAEEDGNFPVERGMGELHPRHDPLRWLAEAAGYSDGERWWEHMVEQRRDGADLFGGIIEAMTALRKELPPHKDDADARREQLREAHMRTVLRAALSENFKRIAIVCGAWHTPALVLENAPLAKDDHALLKGLPRVKVQTTWIPWTYGRLCAASGYGAGVASPGWYHHLWKHPKEVSERWLSRVARLLRNEDLDASSAQTIDAVRLAEALAAIRNRPLPGLPEMNEAAQAIFCFGGATQLKLIHDKLVVGETLGSVPDDTPMVPLQQNVIAEQKRLRLPPKASQETLQLDLRNETDLERTRLLHRLNILGVSWGATQQASGKGTFKEVWSLQWKPEFAVVLVDASAWGNTVLAAAAAFTKNLADTATDLPALTELIGRVFVADLPDAAEHVMVRLKSQAALAVDVSHLMEALPPLATVLRYGNVRQTDRNMVADVVTGLLARICVGLPIACGSRNDDAAEEMFAHVCQVHEAVMLLKTDEFTRQWHEMLRRLSDMPNLHGKIAGRTVRLLLEAGQFKSDEAGRRLSLALSAAVSPAATAAWLDGFLKGSGIILIHDNRLWNLIDQWIGGLGTEGFTQILPLLRRTFSTFSRPERRQMGERAKGARSTMTVPSDTPATAEFDRTRAEAVLPVLRQLLGLN